jgi:hypothetical protein
VLVLLDPIITNGWICKEIRIGQVEVAVVGKIIQEIVFVGVGIVVIVLVGCHNH